MTSNPQAFNAAVTQSEGVKQSDIAAASGSGDRYLGLIKQAEAAHWQRIVAAGDLHGISTPNARDALAFRSRGV